MNMTKHYSRYHGYAYDGVWAAALAIEEVGRKAHAYNLSLADFSYRYQPTMQFLAAYYLHTMNTLLFDCQAASERALLPCLPVMEEWPDSSSRLICLIF